VKRNRGIKKTVVGLAIVVPATILAVVGCHTIGNMMLTDAHHDYYPPALNMAVATGLGAVTAGVAACLVMCVYSTAKYVGGKVLGE
tara:strand:+ start:1423 stop:1680 length:258 start_codon:yes stop_codon:yes gene_type:complete